MFKIIKIVLKLNKTTKEFQFIICIKIKKYINLIKINNFVPKILITFVISRIWIFYIVLIFIIARHINSQKYVSNLV